MFPSKAMSDLESVSSVEALEFPVDEEEGDELIVEEVKRFAHSIGLNGASEAEHDVTILANSTTHPKADVGASENLKQASFITPPKQTEIESNHDMVVESGNRKVSKGIRDHENQLMGYQPLPVKKMLFNFEVSGSWHEEDSGMVAKYPLQVHVLKHLEEKASELLASDVQLYEKFRLRKRKSDVEWLRTVMTSGTLTDKTSARALLVQESPIHNIAALDALLVMCRKKAKRESIQAIDMLKELWLTCLLPPKRKLKLFAARPFSSLFDVKNPVSAHDRDRKVMLWYAESQFKSCYRDYIGVLEVHLHDPVASVRIKILGTVFDLLVQRPEQEQTLLSLLVNKLGDPERKVASRSSFYLLKLVTQHQNMKSVVVKEVKNLLYRPNVSNRTQYYAVCFLNQIYLRKSDSQLASHLIGIYFVFFKALIQKGSFDAKMLSAILTGVNRAFPYTQGETEAFDEHIDTLFRAVHVAPLSTGVQALMLLYQVMESRQSVSDRYYRALYSKLLDQELQGSPKQALFLNVLYKSLRSDPEISRLKAFLKRIFQICGHHTPPFICGCLLLISEILKTRPALKSFILSPEVEDEEEHFSDVPLEEEKDEEPTEDGDELENVAGSDREEVTGSDRKSRQQYRGLHRNPLFCGAEHTCLWELERLSEHYHPSVQVFAQVLLKGDYITYPGDPLQDFTLTRFLDRFMFKNPKQKVSDHGGSVMQNFRKSSVATAAPVNTPEFVTQEEDNVREDEKYLYKFFRQQQQLESSAKTKKEKVKKEKEMDSLDDIDVLLGKDGDLDSVDFTSEFNDKKLKKKIKKKRKEVETDDSDDEGERNQDYSYENFNFEEEDDDVSEGLTKQREPSQADYERVLLENLTSSEDEDEQLMPAKRRKVENSHKRPQRLKSGQLSADSDMFAAAEDFSHILEEESSGVTWKGERISNKQLSWEEKRAASNRPRVSKHGRKKHPKTQSRPPRKMGQRYQGKKNKTKRRGA